MKISQKEFFADLGAPLKNVRWSWGSVRSDGAVFLRVWQDQTREEGRFVRIASSDESAGEKEYGYQERLQHLDLVRSGAPCFLVICQPSKPSESPRKVKDFDSETVFLGGRVIEAEGFIWIQLKSRVPVREIVLKGS